MIVRAAQRGDAAQIAVIWNAVIETTAITFTTDLKTDAGITSDILARGGGFQVAEQDGLVAGFGTYSPFRGGPGYARTMEHSIMLAPHARGSGIGRALMTGLCEHARSVGVHSMWAGISAENPGAVPFHAALGFAEIARLPEVGFKFGRWMDLILMQKIL
ncbi:GNAT family N-acetyltransferase [Puniceibacterium sediminis]|uniref:Phosphinothricin acetyltransferase n=1 Tax=Puniceibacterium sediminis TaxID=1608407 RepID=A0A238XA51_9RHOB|nr:GNAT family N-acetyltransferase [Puniceibacterium sediminis]SNR55502.1 phosphinothricin acetyltransferase [Puniceibacterium sediminis]